MIAVVEFIHGFRLVAGWIPDVSRLDCVWFPSGFRIKVQSSCFKKPFFANMFVKPTGLRFRSTVIPCNHRIDRIPTGIYRNCCFSNACHCNRADPFRFFHLRYHRTNCLQTGHPEIFWLDWAQPGLGWFKGGCALPSATKVPSNSKRIARTRLVPASIPIKSGSPMRISWISYFVKIQIWKFGFMNFQFLYNVHMKKLD